MRSEWNLTWLAFSVVISLVNVFSSFLVFSLSQYTCFVPKDPPNGENTADVVVSETDVVTDGPEWATLWCS